MGNIMARITVEIDDQLLEKVKHIALEKKIPVEAVVDISALSVEASRLVEKAKKESLLAARMAQLKASLFQISTS